MRFFSLLLAVVSIAAAAEPAATLQQPVPEIRFPNGTVFRNVTVVKFERSLVILKSSAGTGPIAYVSIPEPLRSQLIAARDADESTRAAQAQAGPTPQQKEDATIEGQMFVVTQGAGNYKLGGVRVRAFPMSVWQDDPIGTWNMGAPIATAMTDAEGKFKIVLPSKQPYFLFARASRRVGGYTVPRWENYQWVLTSEKITDPKAILLTNDTMDLRRITVDFEGD